MFMRVIRVCIGLFVAGLCVSYGIVGFIGAFLPLSDHVSVSSGPHNPHPLAFLGLLLLVTSWLVGSMIYGGVLVYTKGSPQRAFSILMIILFGLIIWVLVNVPPQTITGIYYANTQLDPIRGFIFRIGFTFIPIAQIVESVAPPWRFRRYEEESGGSF